MDVGIWSLYAVAGFVLLLLALSTVFGIPGNLLLVLFAAGVGYYEGFIRLDWVFIACLIAGWLLGEAFEFFSSAIGARRAQASRRAIIAAYIGGFVGMLAGTAILPVVGTLVGSLLGAFLASYWGEYYHAGSSSQAKRVAIQVVRGQLFGLLFKLAVGLAMAVAILARLPIRG